MIRVICAEQQKANGKEWVKYSYIFDGIIHFLACGLDVTGNINAFMRRRRWNDYSNGYGDGTDSLVLVIKLWSNVITCYVMRNSCENVSQISCAEWHVFKSNGMNIAEFSLYCKNGYGSAKYMYIILYRVIYFWNFWRWNSLESHI